MTKYGNWPPRPPKNWIFWNFLPKSQRSHTYSFSECPQPLSDDHFKARYWIYSHICHSGRNVGGVIILKIKKSNAPPFHFVKCCAPFEPFWVRIRLIPNSQLFFSGLPFSQLFLVVSPEINRQPPTTNNDGPLIVKCCRSMIFFLHNFWFATSPPCTRPVTTITAPSFVFFQVMARGANIFFVYSITWLFHVPCFKKLGGWSQLRAVVIVWAIRDRSLLVVGGGVGLFRGRPQKKIAKRGGH